MKIKQLIISCVLMSVLAPSATFAYKGNSYYYLNGHFSSCITAGNASSTTTISNGTRYLYSKTALSRKSACSDFVDIHMTTVSSVYVCKCDPGYYALQSTEAQDASCTCKQCITGGTSNTADAYSRQSSCDNTNGVTCNPNGSALKYGVLPEGSQRPDYQGDYCAACPPGATRCADWTLAIDSCPKNYFYYAAANVCTQCPNNGLTDDPEMYGAPHPRQMTDCYLMSDNLSDITGKYTCVSSSNDRIYWKN